MSKKLIAGAGVVASFAVALAPLATFAADATWNSDQHTDTLNVTVLPTCAFGAATATPIDGITHNANPSAANGPTVGTPDPAVSQAANNATWADGTDNHLGMTPDASGQNENVTTDTAYYRIFAGTYDASMGTTTLTVVCNQNNGYKIFTQAANLSEGTETIDIKAATGEGTPSATVTGYTITVADDESTGATLAQVTGTTKIATVTSSAASAADGDSYTYTYGIGVAPTQKAATYTGNVVYTLVQQLGS